MKKIILGVIILIAILGLWIMGSYNSLVTLNESVDSQWAQVESQYQRRFDLIPNLVEATKGVMKQEQAIFTAIADARTKYGGAKTVDEKVVATGALDSALSRLLVITENYPQLKSSENVQTLMSQIEGTENRIAVERKRFNDKVQDFNLQIKRFPGSLIAGIFGFTDRAYFQSVSGSESAPKVQF